MIRCPGHPIRAKDSISKIIVGAALMKKLKKMSKITI
jgi:hypothetical protein